MSIIKKLSSVDMARKMVREWPETMLMERDPFELVYTYGVSHLEADKIIKDERYRRNL
jgi:hypothetical protein